ncbi:MerR family transcriptional regulator [Candidatus Dependentiae bacterium]|nr:MerR family transcriptional regulator [Candidatus Dependentiae bacterium]
MRMQRRQFRIGQLAKDLDVERFVIRFWEREFKIKSTRSIGGQRFYNDKDVKTFTFIKELLYDKGFTINGARKHMQLLKEDKKRTRKLIGASQTAIDRIIPARKINTKIVALQKKLMKLRELL